MKFGRNLPRNEVPEWSSEYINYKGLKKLIKSAAEQLNEDHEADLAGFFFNLDRNLETIDTFYNKKYADAARRLKLLYERYGSHVETETEQEELEDLIGALLELRSQLRKLQWYGEVNRRGFVKITKKLDKKVATAYAQQRYLVSKVDPKPFATNAKLSQDMNSVNTWLSRLGSGNTPSSPESTRSSFSLTRPMSKTKLPLPLPNELVQGINQAIQDNDSSSLSTKLQTAQEYGDMQGEPFQRLLLNLLYRAITARAMKCMPGLLENIISLDEEEDINKRNCFHRIIIGVGKSRSTQANQQGSPEALVYDAQNSIVPAEAPVMELLSYGAREVDSSRLPNDSDDTAELITFLLGQLNEQQRTVLASRDSFGRMPLHYAAKYGFVTVSNVLMDRMLQWKLLDLSDGFGSTKWNDTEGNSPLHLAVIGGWRLTTETILAACKASSDMDVSINGWGKSSLLLAMAAKANFYNIIRLLIDAGANVNFQDDQGETALHVSARYGHVECAKTLLEGSDTQRTELDIPENIFGWIPLLVASVDGQLAMVELLLEAGADVDKHDFSGWSAKEHAALRGHFDTAVILAKYTRDDSSPNLEKTPPNSLPKASSLEDRGSSGTSKDIRILPPVKSFGHRYLTTDESMVLVSLGSMDPRKNVKPVDLDNIPYAEAHATQLDTALSVVVSASGANGEPTIIDLPVQDSISTEPIMFTTKDITKTKLVFDIVPTYAGTNEQVVGRGVALLSSIKTTLGLKRMNLQGDISVPIVAAKTLDILGSVNFNFLIATPFSHPNMSITETKTYWKSLTAPMVIGHRGLGKNSASRKSLQLGENTMQSFIAAANLGASYVEFDVQLTKDLVPVIYHDFLVSETGIDAPVHTLTLEQFLHVNDSNTPRPSRPSSPTSTQKYNHPDQHTTTNKPNGKSNTSSNLTTPRRSRANSLGSIHENQQSSDMTERMKHTRDMKLQGYKGNSRGNFIQAPFTTLEEMLRQLPQHIGFNIEMKYPMLLESEEHEMDTYAVELNSFCDTVLKMVYDLAGKRNVIFSSFHPDICLLLSLKQPSIPILFLSDAGTSPVGDIRASSLQEAIRFASRWNLLGIVSNADPLVLCPRLVRVVKESGLVCVSYGTLNNEPSNVAVQVREGIDAVIVDSVLAIRKGLTAEGKAAEVSDGAVGGSGVPPTDSEKTKGVAV